MWEVFDFAWGDPDQNPGATADDGEVPPPDTGLPAIEDGDPDDAGESVTTTEPEQSHESNAKTPNGDDLPEVPQDTYLEFEDESEPLETQPDMEICETQPDPVPAADESHALPSLAPASEAASMPPPPPVDPALLEHKRKVMARMAEIRLVMWEKQQHNFLKWGHPKTGWIILIIIGNPITIYYIFWGGIPILLGFYSCD